MSFKPQNEADALAEEAYFNYMKDEAEKRASLEQAHELHTSCPICGSTADFNVEEQSCYNESCGL